jgi:hypothetical protein
MKLNQNTKMKVVTGDVSFFTTVKQIRGDFGTSMRFTSAVKSALDVLESSRTQLVKPIGVAGTWGNFQIQLDIV